MIEISSADGCIKSRTSITDEAVSTHWASTHPEWIRQYRVEERKDRAEQKTLKRSIRRNPPKRK